MIANPEYVAMTLAALEAYAETRDGVDARISAVTALQDYEENVAAPSIAAAYGVAVEAVWERLAFIGIDAGPGNGDGLTIARDWGILVSRAEAEAVPAW
jgi:hypothetical protein